MDVFKIFGINWKILLGQIINFLIILYLLKRFVYKPFLAVLEKRTKIIEDGVKKETEAQEKINQIEMERERVLKEAQEKAALMLRKTEAVCQQKKEEVLEKAEEEKQKILKEARQLGQTQIEEMKKDFYQKNLELILIGIERVLKEKIDLNKDKEIIKNFINGEKNSKIS